MMLPLPHERNLLTNEKEKTKTDVRVHFPAEQKPQLKYVNMRDSNELIIGSRTYESMITNALCWIWLSLSCFGKKKRDVSQKE